MAPPPSSTPSSASRLRSPAACSCSAAASASWPTPGRRPSRAAATRAPSPVRYYPHTLDRHRPIDRSLAHLMNYSPSSDPKSTGEATVKHVKLGDLDVSRIGLGAMGMSIAYGSAADRDDAKSIRAIHRALQLGVTLI